MALDVYLIRHGKTVFNTTGRLQGWSDSPLMPEGRAAAEAVGRALAEQVAFDAAFSSVSPRAAETAKLILQAKNQAGLPLQTIEHLREYCFGSFEGELTKNIHEIAAKDHGFASVEAWRQAYRRAGRHLLAESISRLDPLGLAETETQFMQRMKQALAELAERAPHNSKVLAVSHGMTITGILKSIDPQSTPYQSVGNVTLSRLRFEHGKWQIVSIGETVS